MGNRILIDVEGVDDPWVVAVVEKTIRESFYQRALPGSWRVHVCPSRAGARWILTVQGLDARRTVSMDVPVSLLTELVPVRLRESLERLSAARVVEAGDDGRSDQTIRPNEKLSA